MKHLSIWQKIFLGIGGIFVFGIAGTGYSWHALQEAKQKLSSSEQVNLFFIDNAERLESAITEAFSRFSHFFAYTAEDSYKRGMETLDNASRLHQALEELAYQEKTLTVFKEPLESLSQYLPEYSRNISRSIELYHNILSLESDLQAKSKAITQIAEKLLLEELQPPEQPNAPMNRNLIQLLIGMLSQRLNPVSFSGALLTPEFSAQISLFCQALEQAQIALERQSTEPIFQAKKLLPLQKAYSEMKAGLDHLLSQIRKLDAMLAEQSKLQIQLHSNSQALFSQSFARYRNFMAERTQKLEEQTRILLCITAAFSVLALLVGIALTRAIASPVRRCLAFADAVAQGDSSGMLQLDREDEVGHLANAMTAMVSDFNARLEERFSVEQALESSKQQLNQVLQRIPGVVALKKTEGQYTLINEAYTTVLNRPSEDILGKTIHELLPSGYELLEMMDAEIVSSQKSISMEFSLPYPDRSTHDFLVTKVPLLDDQEKVEQILTLAIEITGRKKLEHDLRRLGILADTALMLAQAGHWYVDPKDSSCFFASERLVSLYGGESVGEIRIDFSDWYANIASVDIKDALNVRRQINGILHGRQDRADFEYRYPKENTGEIIWVRGIVERLLDASGRMERIIGLSQDITFYKTQQMEIDRERLRLQTILDSSPVGVGFAANHCIRYMNNGMKALVSVREGDDPLDAALDKEEALAIRESLEKGAVQHRELTTRDRNGILHETIATFDKADYHGERGVIAWVMDVTHLKEIEKELVHARNLAEAATRARSDFLANMSHEIRTPMNAITGMVHLVLRTDLTPVQQDYLDKLQTSAQMLLGIINDILDFSKIEAGKMEMEHIPFSLSKALRNISDLHSTLAQSKGLALRFTIEDNVPDGLIGDPIRLQQVLSNLVGNAIKFTDKGEISVTVQPDSAPSIASGDAQQNHVLRFMVRDTGIGMSKEQCEKLFQPFVQADSSTTRRYGGTGLGLTICNRLVTMMGGTIHLESALGQGSLFSFTTVFQVASPSQALSAQEGTTALPSAGEKTDNEPPIRVLVTDDNEINRLVAEGILESFGMTVELANTGQEAVEKGSTGAYDIILMDIQMPGMDGLEATRRLREFPACRNIPIIAMTARAMDEDRDKSLENGLDAHITKPIDPKALEATIQKWVHLFRHSGGSKE